MMQPTASRQRGSFSLAEYPSDMVPAEVFPLWPARAISQDDPLLEQYGPDIALPDLRHEIAQCERLDRLTGGCGVLLRGL
jgi:hypothetical protein